MEKKILYKELLREKRGETITLNDIFLLDKYIILSHLLFCSVIKSFEINEEYQYINTVMVKYFVDKYELLYINDLPNVVTKKYLEFLKSQSIKENKPIYKVFLQYSDRFDLKSKKNYYYTTSIYLETYKQEEIYTIYSNKFISFNKCFRRLNIDKNVKITTIKSIIFTPYGILKYPNNVNIDATEDIFEQDKIDYVNETLKINNIYMNTVSPDRIELFYRPIVALYINPSIYGFIDIYQYFVILLQINHQYVYNNKIQSNILNFSNIIENQQFSTQYIDNFIEDYTNQTEDETIIFVINAYMETKYDKQFFHKKELKYLNDTIRSYYGK
jgi:hypothetical protein